MESHIETTVTRGKCVRSEATAGVAEVIPAVEKGRDEVHVHESDRVESSC